VRAAASLESVSSIRFTSFFKSLAPQRSQENPTCCCEIFALDGASDGIERVHWCCAAVHNRAFCWYGNCGQSDESRTVSGVRAFRHFEQEEGQRVSPRQIV